MLVYPVYHLLLGLYYLGLESRTPSVGVPTQGRWLPSPSGVRAANLFSAFSSEPPPFPASVISADHNEEGSRGPREARERA